jgi:hypothetical protein
MLVLGPGFHDRSADLVSQRQGQFLAGGNAILPEADVRMADPASGDLYHDLVVTGLWLGYVHYLQGGAHGG